VAIRHPLVRDAIYAGITAARRRTLHARAAAAVSESASWEHRVAALDHPDEGLAGQLERLADEEAAGGRLALAATHLQWASDISPARADRERRLLTAALHLMLSDEARGMALRAAVEESAPSPLRNGVLGTIAFSSGQLADAEQRFSEALAQTQAQDDEASRHLAAMMANRLAGTYTLLGDGKRYRPSGGGRWTPVAWTPRPPARRGPWSPSAPPRRPGRARRWPSSRIWTPIRRGSTRLRSTA
jgi:hypothetical protein